MSEFLRKLARTRKRDELAERLREELALHREMAGGSIGRPSRLLEESHEVWTLGWVEHLWLDMRHAARALAKSPAFALLATVGTALGVAALTSVLSVADRAFVRPLPYVDSGRLVIVSDQLLKLGLPRFPTSFANFADYRAQTEIFEDLAGFQPRALTVSTGDRVERVAGMAATPNQLSVLGVRPAEGRWWTDAERRDLVAVVGERFRGSGEIRIDGQLYRVIGAVPPGFAFRTSGDAPEIWIPSRMETGPRDAAQTQVVGRLRAGVSPEAAAAAMHSLAASLKQQHRAGMGPQGQDGGFDIAVVPLREELFGSSRTTLYALAAGSAILLALAFANTALLWLGRAAARRRESAVRIALGAPRPRIAQQLVVEALLPSLAGGAAGLAMAALALRSVEAAALSELAALDRLTVDFRAFFLALFLSAGAGVLCGLVPMLAPSLKRHREGRLGRVLIGVQVALACALLAPSLLLVRSLAALQSVNPGFRTDGLLTASVSLPPQTDSGRYAGRLGAELARFGGTVASALPLTFGEGGDPFSIEGRAYGSSGTLPQFAHHVRVGHGFFELMRIPMVAGRGLEAADDDRPVAVVNQTLARAFWANESPLGKRILMGAPRAGAAWMTIVGIAVDIHTGPLSAAPASQIFRPIAQAPSRSLAVIVPDSIGAAGLARVLREVDPEVPAYGVRSMQDRVAGSIQRPRFRTAIFSAYGALAFLLAAFGVYSLSVYAAARRRREFAVRAALGASGGRLFGGMVGGTVRPAALGAAAGLAGGYAIARAMATLFFRADPSDASVYALAAGLALAVAAAAGALAARPVFRVSAAEILRSE
jgi:putative ABC transport system permease protein